MVAAVEDVTEQQPPQGLKEFHRYVERFFSEITPPLIDETTGGSLTRAKAWRSALHDAGLAGFSYPVEYGGSGLGPGHKAIYAELSPKRVPREDHTFGIGVGMALPVLRDHASHDLKQRLLRAGLRGEQVWSQMYSEPGAGSDLAGLNTKAELDGDEWVVTGQKVWTSGAQQSQYAILLARTDFDAPKHSGITMFVLPIEQEGVEVRPLRQMTGDAEFNEIFINEAQVPRDFVVGDVNDGWRMAVALLAHERVATGTASMGQAGGQRSRAGRVPIPTGQLIDLACERGRLDDPGVRQQLASLVSGERIAGYIRQRGDGHPSIGKLWRTIQGRAAAELAGQLCFPAGPAWSANNEEGDWFGFQMLNCRGMSHGGGTDEIQRNTLGERALGLPREPGPDRATPFRELPRN
jgi:alkylation response protein AidB-like acyl-CoA dehydrogenase